MAVCETSDFCTLEGRIDKWPDGSLINLLIIGMFVESEVEIEDGFLKIFGEVHFLLILADNNGLPVLDADDVSLCFGLFFFGKRSLPNGN